MKFKEAVHNWKIVVATIAILTGGAGAIGWKFDRPAWASEVEIIAIQTQRNSLKLLWLDVRDVQRRIWSQEDRFKKAPTTDGKQRLRELRRDLKDLRDLYNDVRKKGK